MAVRSGVEILQSDGRIVRAVERRSAVAGAGDRAAQHDESMVGVGENDAVDDVQPRKPDHLRPRRTAVGGAQQRQLSARPAALRVGEADGLQMGVDGRGLFGPAHPAVCRVIDASVVARHPGHVGRHRGDGVEVMVHAGVAFDPGRAAVRRPPERAVRAREPAVLVVDEGDLLDLSLRAEHLLLPALSRVVGEVHLSLASGAHEARGRQGVPGAEARQGDRVAAAPALSGVVGEEGRTVPEHPRRAVAESGHRVQVLACEGVAALRPAASGVSGDEHRPAGAQQQRLLRAERIHRIESEAPRLLRGNEVPAHSPVPAPVHRSRTVADQPACFAGEADLREFVHEKGRIRPGRASVGRAQQVFRFLHREPELRVAEIDGNDVRADAFDRTAPGLSAVVAAQYRAAAADGDDLLRIGEGDVIDHRRDPRGEALPGQPGIARAGDGPETADTPDAAVRRAAQFLQGQTAARQQFPAEAPVAGAQHQAGVGGNQACRRVGEQHTESEKRRGAEDVRLRRPARAAVCRAEQRAVPSDDPAVLRVDEGRVEKLVPLRQRIEPLPLRGRRGRQQQRRDEQTEDADETSGIHDSPDGSYIPEYSAADRLMSR